MQERRDFLKTVSIAASTAYFSSPLAAFPNELAEPNISCQYYPWFTFFKREGIDWHADLSYSIKTFASVGFGGFEPTFESVDEVENLKPLLKKYQLPMHSFYVNSILHDPKQVAASMSQGLPIP